MNEPACDLSVATIRQKIRYWEKPIRLLHPERENRLAELRGELKHRAAMRNLDAVVRAQYQPRVSGGV